MLDLYDLNEYFDYVSVEFFGVLVEVLALSIYGLFRMSGGINHQKVLKKIAGRGISSPCGCRLSVLDLARIDDKTQI